MLRHPGLRSDRLKETVSVRFRLKINCLPTTAAVAVIFGRNALHDLSRQGLQSALKPSVEG